MKLCGFDIGAHEPFFLIAGTCVVEGEASAIDTAGTLKEITAELGIPFIYKSSYDKANRSSKDGFRGPGMEEGLANPGGSETPAGRADPHGCARGHAAG